LQRASWSSGYPGRIAVGIHGNWQGVPDFEEEEFPLKNFLAMKFTARPTQIMLRSKLHCHSF
jgi:hypothetical protein